MAGSDQEVTRGVSFDRTLLTGFQFNIIQPANLADAIAISVGGGQAPIIVASLVDGSALHIDDGTDRICLTATVGWQAVTNAARVSRVEVLFRLFRQAPITGPLVFSALDSANAMGASRRVSTFSHVDTLSGFSGRQVVTYFLTVELPLAGSAATITGPLSLAAARLESSRFLQV